MHHFHLSRHTQDYARIVVEKCLSFIMAKELEQYNLSYKRNNY